MRWNSSKQIRLGPDRSALIMEVSSSQRFFFKSVRVMHVSYYGTLISMVSTFPTLRGSTVWERGGTLGSWGVMMEKCLWEQYKGEVSSLLLLFLFCIAVVFISPISLTPPYFRMLPDSFPPPPTPPFLLLLLSS